MRLVDQRGHFRRRELRRVDFIGQRKYAAGNRGLDYICAVLHLKTNGLSNRVRPVGDTVCFIWLATEKHVTETTGRIEMSAGRADSESLDQHARADDDAFVN